MNIHSTVCLCGCVGVCVCIPDTSPLRRCVSDAEGWWSGGTFVAPLGALTFSAHVKKVWLKHFIQNLIINLLMTDSEFNYTTWITYNITGTVEGACSLCYKPDYLNTQWAGRITQRSYSGAYMYSSPIRNTSVVPIWSNLKDLTQPYQFGSVPLTCIMLQVCAL